MVVCAYTPQLLRRLRQENYLNLRNGRSSELRWYHCSLAWAIERGSISKQKKKERIMLDSIYISEKGTDQQADE